MSPSPASLPLVRRTLDNGLELLIVPTSHEAAAVQLCVQAGAVDELAEEHGLAHLVEHMLFKGTAERAVGRSAADIERQGGELNAWTSMDETTLHAVVAPEGWRTALDVQADMLLNPLIDPGELARELDVVIEELRSYDNEPDSMLGDHVQRALWGKHPYGRRVIGTERELRKHDAARLRAFLRREYVPNRARLCVVGPVDPDEVQAEAARLLGRWQRGADRRPLPPAPEKPSRHTAHVALDFESTAIELAWLAPPPTHPDTAALETVAWLLGQGAGAILADDLQHVEHLAYGVWAELGTGLAGSNFSIGFAPMEKQSKKAIAATLDRVEHIVRSPPGPAIERARTALVADFLFGLETVDEIASDLLWYATHYGDPLARDHHRAALHAVTVQDVQRVTATWLRRDHATLGALDPSMSEAALKRALHPRPREPERKGVVHHTHPKGARVLIQAEPSEIVAISLMSLGGDLRAEPATAGIGTAWARTVLGGAGPRDAQRLGEHLDTLATELDPLTGRHGVGFSLTAPAANLDAVLDLLGDLILDPHFAEEDLERTRDELLDDLRTRADRPSDLAMELSRALRWRGHPWGLPSGGTEDTLAALTGEALRRWHDLHFCGRDLVISVVGGVHPEAVLDGLDWLDELPEVDVPLAPRPAPQPELHGVHTLEAGHEQAHVWLVGTGPAHGERDRRGLELAQAILDGQSGRLFMDLRERRGLAYEVWAQVSEGVDGGSFRVGLACDPERIDEAAAALRAAVHDLIDRPPDDDELERARRLLTNRVALDAQRTMGRAGAMTGRALFGTPEPLPTLRARLERTGREDVAAELARTLAAGLAEIRVLPVPSRT